MQSASVIGKRKDHGVVIREPSQFIPRPAAVPAYGQGKGKAVLCVVPPVYECVSDSDDDSASNAAPLQLPSSACFQAAMLDYSHCENGEGARPVFAPPMAGDVELSPLPLQVIYPNNYCQGNSFGHLAQLSDQNYGGVSIYGSGVENDTMVLAHDEKTISDIQPILETSFQSIDSESSIVRHINAMGVEQELPKAPSSLSSAAKRRKGNNEDDSASSDLKRSKP
ncbi:hypothetical protein BVRB_4g097620 [Beta vulgaris subsp. vulgaris]|uniref:Uncharacterized protein n=1 Tax=Beta vulgaris subsp. vulgaris TaxID=3555 RepID=A0A0J8BAG1_BETVV|nr:hypothetical protein BVRB_4g097620 [Beta vulgaris subsp. vulgaris]